MNMMHELLVLILITNLFFGENYILTPYSTPKAPQQEQEERKGRKREDVQGRRRRKKKEEGG